MQEESSAGERREKRRTSEIEQQDTSTFAEDRYRRHGHSREIRASDNHHGELIDGVRTSSRQS